MSQWHLETFPYWDIGMHCILRKLPKSFIYRRTIIYSAVPLLAAIYDGSITCPLVFMYLHEHFSWKVS